MTKRKFFTILIMVLTLSCLGGVAYSADFSTTLAATRTMLGMAVTLGIALYRLLEVKILNRFDKMENAQDKRFNDFEHSVLEALRGRDT